MDNMAAELSKLIKNKPDCLKSSRALKASMLDNSVFNQEQKKLKLLLMGYEAGVVSVFQKPCNYAAEANRLMKKITDDNYGIDEDIAYWIVDTWLIGLGKKSASRHQSGRQSATPNTAVQRRPQNPVAYNGKNKKLIRNFQTIFGDSEIWSVYRKIRKNNDLLPSFIAQKVQIGLQEKQIILQKLGLGNHTDDLLHVTAWADRSAAWALTHDGLYLMGNVYLVSDKDNNTDNIAKIAHGLNLGMTEMSKGILKLLNLTNGKKNILYNQIESATVVPLSHSFANEFGYGSLGGLFGDIETPEKYILQITDTTGKIFTLMDTEHIFDDEVFNPRISSIGDREIPLDDFITAQGEDNLTFLEKLTEFLSLCRY